MIFSLAEKGLARGSARNFYLGASAAACIPLRPKWRNKLSFQKSYIDTGPGSGDANLRMP
jgi:hypothetical protein